MGSIMQLPYSSMCPVHPGLIRTVESMPSRIAGPFMIDPEANRSRSYMLQGTNPLVSLKKTWRWLAMASSGAIRPLGSSGMFTDPTLPDAETLREILAKLGGPAKQLLRQNEKEYKELRLAHAGDEEIVAAIAANPNLLQRPIIVSTAQAVIGRPPEKVLTVL